MTKTFKNLPKTLSIRHQNGVHADAIPLNEEKAPSDHPLIQRDLVFQHGSTHTRALGERDAAKNYIKRFYSTFDQHSDLTLFQANSVTVQGTCFKKDLYAILLAEINNSNPIFGSLENIWICETCVPLA